jgi:O-antigen ligase
LVLSYYSALSIACVILTGSRTGFVQLGAVAFMRLFTTRHRVRILVLMLLASPAIWFAMGDRLQKRITTIWDPSQGPKNAQESAVSRIHFVEIGIRLWGEQPLLGYGPASFKIVSGTDMQPHNLYVQLIAELGTPATLAFLAVLGGFVLNHFEIRRLQRGLAPGVEDFPRRLSAAILMALAVMLIQGLTGHNLFRMNWMIYGAFQAIAVQCAKDKARRNSFELSYSHSYT